MYTKNKLIRGLILLASSAWTKPVWAELDVNSVLPQVSVGEPAIVADIWTTMSLGLVLVVAYGISWVVSRPVSRLSEDDDALAQTRQENWYMKQALDRLPEGLLITDEAGRSLLANDRLRQWAAGNAEALGEASSETIQKAVSQALATGAEVQCAMDGPEGQSGQLRVQAIAAEGKALGALVWFGTSAEAGLLNIAFGVPVRALKLERLKRRAFLDEHKLELTSTEFDLLTYLAERRGTVQTRDALLHHVWGHAFPGNSRTVDTHIRRLREKLGDASVAIETVRGAGYRFVPDTV